MTGKGGHKHRRTIQERKKSQRMKKVRENIARARGLFEAKGQAWDPKNNPPQLAALNHNARRHVLKTEGANF